MKEFFVKANFIRGQGYNGTLILPVTQKKEKIRKEGKNLELWVLVLGYPTHQQN